MSKETPDGSDQTDPVAGAAPAGPAAKKKRPFAVELVIVVGLALLISFLVKTFLIQAFWVPSGSMEMTLEKGDRILVNKLVYDTRDIRRGEVVVFEDPGGWLGGPSPQSTNPAVRGVQNLFEAVGLLPAGDEGFLVKRVIGLPGDRVACCNANGQVTVNGVPLEESDYLFPGNSPSDIPFDVKVPQGSIWVMGDHRAVSGDSRVHLGDPGGGFVPIDHVVGRAFVKVWPIGRWGLLPVPDTFDNPKLDKQAAAPVPH